MTFEESREVIPLMENMINQIEEQQELMAEMYQEMQQRDGQLNLFQEQNQRLQELNNELQEQLQILPSIEELLELLEKKDGEVQTLKEENRMLKDENQQWKELTENAYSFIVVCNRDDSICCNKIWDIFRRFYSIFRGTMEWYSSVLQMDCRCCKGVGTGGR